MTIIVGMLFLCRSFLTGTNDFEKVERASATFSGLGDSIFPTALRTFNALSFGEHGSRVEKSWNLQSTRQWQDSVYTFSKIYLLN